MGHTEIVASLSSEETNGSRIEVADKSFEEKTKINDDSFYVETDITVTDNLLQNTLTKKMRPDLQLHGQDMIKQAFLHFNDSRVNDVENKEHSLEAELVFEKDHEHVYEITELSEIGDVETKAPERPVYARYTRITESNNVADSIDGFDEMKEIDEDLLVKRDAVGIRNSFGQIKQGQHVWDHELETKIFGDEDSYSKNLGSTSDHDLETRHFTDEDSDTNDLGSTLDEMKQDPHFSDHDLETKISGDEDSYSRGSWNNLG
ncbi:hypothetical protein L1987_59855 [Smallanthus sonchifolius]|uniref:Uncharacterized protein n=1 Tax=Smallanthus sonchifolius TaxID=185202 RepID=A0ACB9D6V3_9ASTR|nr:hypothetical protein L1987_59855 [Smallanthus sonchifolius]